jgi:hypothetical protein
MDNPQEGNRYVHFNKFYYFFNLCTLALFNTTKTFYAGFKENPASYFVQSPSESTWKLLHTLKSTTKPLRCITSKGTTKLPEDHGFKAAKYIAQYVMKGTPHV